MIVTVRRVDSLEGFSGVDGTIEAGVGDINFVRIFRVRPYVREIPGTLAKTVIVIDEGPFRAAVVAAIQAALFRLDEGVNDVRITAGNRDADTAKRTFGETFAFEALPGRAVVGGAVQAIFRAAAVQRPGSAPAFPHRGKKNVRILRIENDVNCAGAIVEIENFLPSFAAIDGAENAAVRVRAISVAKSGDKNDVRICWMNDECADVARVFQADVGPRFAGVR